MAITTVRELIQHASLLYSEPITIAVDGTVTQDGDRLTAAMWLTFLNSSYKAIVGVRPDANAETEVITLAVGSKQEIPSDSIRLIDVLCNMGVGGATPGAVVTYCTKLDLDSINDGWHSDTGAQIIQHFFYDVRNPKVFWVTPPALGTSTLRVIVATIPALNTTYIQTINLSDIFYMPMLNWMLYQAFMVDTDSPYSAETAARYRDAWGQDLGSEGQQGVNISPNPVAKR